MRIRCLLAAVALAAVVPAGQSTAASCPLITDARGDSAPLFYGQTVADDALGARESDILAADGWTDSTRLNAVIQVAELPLPPTIPRDHGFDWEFEFRAEGGTITLSASENNGNWNYGARWDNAASNYGTGGATTTVPLYSTDGTKDTKRGEIRLATPLAVFAPYTKVSKGVRWKPSVLSFVMNGSPSARVGGVYIPSAAAVGSQSDRADGTRPVIVGRPVCAR
jgi:hypothetical protein